MSSGTYSIESVSNSVTAGYVAGVCGVMIGHPLDSMKVLLQTNPGESPVTASDAIATTSSSSARVLVSSTSATQSAGMSVPQHGSSARMSTIASTNELKGRSLRGLYAGMTGPLFTIGLLQSAYFALYDSSRRVLHRRDFPESSDNDYLHKDSLKNVAYASAVAGSVSSLITSPVMVVKTKQQIMVWGFRKAVVETLRTTQKSRLQSLRNFYVGFAPHFVAVTVGRSIYMTSYEWLKQSFVERRQNSATGNKSYPAEITTQERMFSASIAGMVCWAGIFPLDAIQNKMYQPSLHNGQKTAVGMARDMYNSNGKSIRPFFRGFGVTVLRAGPVAAVVLPVYDIALEWLAKR